MAREVKFRAWDGKTMFYTDDHTLLQFKKERWIMLSTYGSDAFYWVEEGKPGHVLMQYTGLKDKSGKSIFDGDIVKYEDGTIGKVWQFGSGQWVVAMPSGSSDFNDNWHIGVTVIGNIYSNPELLESNN